MKESTYTTIMLVPDGTQKRRGFRIRSWLLKLIVISLAIILVGIVLFFSYYGKVLSRAAMAERLSEENEGLRRYQYKVQMLEENLKQAREIVGRLTQLAGVDFEFPELPDDSTLFTSLVEPGVVMINRNPETDLNWPSGLPIQGFISQDFDIEDSDQYHPGVDIACAEGTPVLATAYGTIVYAEFDSTYGNLLVIQHSDTVVTLYGHNNKLLMEPGPKVMVGSRIALSGNTGTSTAPHLHYEIRVNDKPIDPLENQKYEKKQFR